MVSGTQWPGGDPFLQRQNEPSVAVSTRNPLHLLAGANDYRTVDLPGLPNGEVTGDAWLGAFKTIDSGQTWFSLLLPGYPQDTSADGLASPLKGFAAAADPTVRAGTNGLFYYSGIAFNRGAQGASVVFVARYIDNNNQENGDPIAYVGTTVVAKSDGTVFLDKPWVAVDIPRDDAKMCRISSRQPDGSIQVQSFRAGNIYVAYSVLTGSGASQRGQILFSHSRDCGVTWSKPVQISRKTDRINQGAVIAINPQDGTVYVAWRRFASPAPSSDNDKDKDDQAQTDAILVARSPDEGESFGEGRMAREMPQDQGRAVNWAKAEEDGEPFDQGTSNVSFRFNAYPALAVGDDGRVYLAWAERGIGPGGDTRVMLATARGDDEDLDFSALSPVENPATRGHQIMPSLTFAGGKVVLVFYDLREDSSDAQYTPLGGGQYSKTEVPVGDLAPPIPQPANVFNQFIADASAVGSPPIKRRHTIDVRATQANPGKTPVFSPSVQVSDYLFGSRPGSHLIEQLQFNPPNLPLFAMGTVPFFGDYIDVAPAPAFVPGKNGTWKYNTAASPAPVFHTVWTDNRDVQPPADGDWTHYTPPFSPSVQGTSLFDPTQQVPSCVTGQEGMRNQNVYSARITQGLLAGSLGNSKPLGNATLPDGRVVQIQRGFVVFVQNALSTVADYRLTITNQPAGGKASFLQFAVAGQPDPQTQLDVEIPALSTASRTVFVNAPDPTASVLVTVQQITAIGGTPIPGGLQTSVLLNPDVTNPSISNPSISNPSISNPSISNAEVFNPSISNPSISNPNISNPSISNPSISNPSISNVTVVNPDIANPSISNPSISNPSISNPDLANPSISNPSISNAAMQDTTWTVTNNGNTAGSFNVNLLAGKLPPNTVVTQLLIHGIYNTPVADACTLKETTKTVLMANVPNPTFMSSGANNAMNTPSVPLAPGESIQVTIRVLDPNPPAPGVVSYQPAKAVKPQVASQAVNTVDAANGVTQPPTAGGPITISTTFLLNAVLGSSYQSVLHANGGYGAQTWSISGGGLPPGLMLTPSSGVISGIPASLGLYNFIVQVQDSATPIDSATQPLSLLVVNPLMMITTALPSGQVGQPYNAAVQTSGGFGTLTWSVTSGALPGGLSLNSSTGAISGTPTTAGTFPFTVAVQDTNAPPQVVSNAFAIVIQAANSSTLTFGQQPSTTPTGQPITPTVTVVAKDSHGAVLPAVNVTLAFQANPSGATLSGGMATTNASGIASFPSLSVNKVGTGYTLAASATGFSGATSSAFNITPVGVNLSFTVQPGLSTGGQPITPIVQVQVQDNSGGAITGVNVTMALGTNPCAGTLTGTTTVMTGPTGNAAFPNLAETAGGAGYTLVASAAGATPVTSNPFTVIGFCPTGSLAFAHSGAVTALLANGQVLIAGGTDNAGATADAELYDPGTGIFTTTGSMTTPRNGATATVLNDGRVLIAGGSNTGGTYLASAEIYNPGTGVFSLTGSMTMPRQLHTATLLPSGKVLIAGGSPASATATASTELYDPSAGTFTATGSMLSARWGAGATLLPNGRVLMTGGFPGGPGINFLSGAELYDPTTGTFSVTGSMNVARYSFTLTLLGSGKVLVAGGYGTTLQGSDLSSAEIYDPSTGAWQFTGSMTTAAGNRTATLLPNGKVIVAGGGLVGQPVFFSAAELYDPVAGIFSSTASMNTGRMNAAASMLGNGTVLIAGGFNGSALSSAELYLAFAGPPLKVSTLELPAGDLAQVYSTTLNTTGGTGAVTWSRSGGTLPPGLMLSAGGVISGTPTAAGTFNFMVQATDSGTPPQTAYQPLSIQILNTSATLTVQVQPVAVVAGQVMVPPPQVKVQNSGGPVVGQTVTLALGNNPVGATLSGAIAVSGVGGLATFDNLSVSTFGTGFTLVASATGFAGTTSNAFNVLPAGATLAFLVQPSNGLTGQAISPAVAVRASDGNGLPIAGVTVTLVFGANPGGSALSGASAITDGSGIATFASLSVSNMGQGYTLMASAPNFTGATSASFNIAPGAPLVQLAPSGPLTFTVQPVGVAAPTQMVTVTNTGGALLHLASITIAGSGFGLGPATTCPTGASTLGVGVNCVLSITYTPLFAGTVTGQITITDDAPGSPQIIQLMGTGGQPQVALSTTTITFASQAVGSSSPGQPVTLTNTGGVPLTVTGIVLGGANTGDFSESDNCGTVAAGATCTITITFTPSAVGRRSAQATITDNANPGTQIVFFSGPGNTPATGFGLDTISTYAGGGPLGGPALSTLITEALGIARDSAGNLYFPSYQQNVILKMDTGGNVTVFAGNGQTGYSGDGGPATSATIGEVEGIALDGQGNLFLADHSNFTIRRIDAATGIITTIAGTGTGIGSYTGDGGPATKATLNFVRGVAVDGTGNVFIADTFNNVVRRVDASTQVITTYAGNGTNSGPLGDGGPATSARLSNPSGVAVDAAGNLFIAEGSRVRRVDAVTHMITTAESGLTGPKGLSFDTFGNLYIGDLTRVLRVDGVTHAITTVAGNGTTGFSGDGGPATSALLNLAWAALADPAGNVYIADGNNNRIRKVDAGTHFINTIAGGGTGGDGGPATSALLSFFVPPTGIAFDGGGNLFIAEVESARVRRVDGGSKTITTVAGLGFPVFSVPSGPAASSGLAGPLDVAFDPAGNLYIIDNGAVLKVNASTHAISPLALPATVQCPETLVADASGFLFVADGCTEIVFRVDPSTGAASPYAGNGTPGYGGDGGPATSASLRINFGGLALDSAGSLYIADDGNNVVRKVDATQHFISTVAGNFALGFGYSGDGGPATSAALGSPYSVALDSFGNLFIADGNGVIRRVSASNGIITTVSGNFNALTSLSGDGGDALLAAMAPAYLAFDSSGGLYFSDFGSRVRQVQLAPSASPAPTSLAFPPTAVGAMSAAQPVTFTNAGNGAMTISNVTASGDFTQTNNCPGMLAPGANCTISVISAPAGVGVRAGSLTIMDNAGSGSQVISLAGTGAVVASLTFQVQPSNAVAGQPITPAVQVLVSDASNVPIANVSVTLLFATNPGGATLAGAMAASNLSGIATFPGLSVSNLGLGYTLVATAPSFVGTTSSAFNVVSATGALFWVVQPSNVTAGQPFMPALQVLALDATGAALAGATVTLSAGTNPCPGSVGMGMNNPMGITGANGLAVFSGVLIDHAGGLGFTAVATTPGVPPATSNPFNVIGFCTTGSMTSTRYAHTMTVLPNGKVLVAGGDDNATGFAIASAELYDPATGTFTATESMKQARDSHTATLLPNGKVLIAGGYDATGSPLFSAELYDPAAGTFTLTGMMTVDRAEQTATLLPNGKVLIAAGASFTAPIAANAELYDPSSGTFTASAGTMVDGNRSGHRAVLLLDGTVLIAGGFGTNGYTSSAEIYNPGSDSFTATGSMTANRYYPTATLLSSGQVLIDSGHNGTNVNLTADVYNPGLRTFTQAGTTTASHYGGVAGLLPKGKVLIAGGGGGGVRNPLADIFDPDKGIFLPTASMKDARVFAAAAQLNNGQLLVSGGADGPGNITATAEYYVTSLEASTVSLPDGVVSQPYSAAINGSGGTGNVTLSVSSGALPNGLSLVNGQNPTISGTPTAAGLFTFSLTATDPGPPVETDTASFSIRIWSPAAGPGANLNFVVQPTTAQAGLPITPNVAVSVQTTSGPVSGAVVTLAIENNPRGGTLSGTASAVTGPSGIAVFPGLSINNIGPGYSLLASTPNFPGAISNSFDVVPPTPILSFAPQPGTGTALPVFLPAIQVQAVDGNGAPLPYIPITLTVGTNACAGVNNTLTGNGTTGANGIATVTNMRVRGGGPGFTLLASTFRGTAVGSSPFDLIGFCGTGGMAAPRWDARSTLLPSGKILVTGGAIVPGPVVLNSAELYDPTSRAFSGTGNLNVARYLHTSTLLPNGLVLIAGGAGASPLSSAKLYDPASGAFTPPPA